MTVIPANDASEAHVSPSWAETKVPQAPADPRRPPRAITREKNDALQRVGHAMAGNMARCQRLEQPLFNAARGIDTAKLEAIASDGHIVKAHGHLILSQQKVCRARHGGVILPIPRF